MTRQRQTLDDCWRPQPETDATTTTIPNPSISSKNYSSMSAYATRPPLTRRRDRVWKRFLGRTRNHDFACCQETNFSPRESSALKNPHSIILYNNHPHPTITSTRACYKAGTAIAISNKVARTSTLVHTIIVPGHIHSVTVIPHDSRVHSYVVYNVYLASGNPALNDQHVQALTRRPSARYQFFVGDWNNKTHPDQTSAPFKPMSGVRLHNWESFLTRHKLSLVPSDIHTFLGSDGNTSMLDRCYHSFTETDLTLITPSVTIPIVHHLPPTHHHAFSLHCHVLRANRPSKVPSWLPLTSEFRKAHHLAWTTFSPIFTKNPFARLRAFKALQHEVAKRVLRDRVFRAPHPHQRIAVATNALRETTRLVPRRAELDRLAKMDPSLPPLLVRQGYSPSEAVHRHLETLLDQHAQPHQEATHPQLPSPPTPTATSAPAPTNFVTYAKSFLPSTRRHLTALRESADASLAIEPERMALILKKAWEGVYAEPPPINRRAKRRALNGYRRRVTSLPSLPTLQDMIVAIKKANNSSSGLDGVPMTCYKADSELAAQLLVDVLHALARGELPPSGSGFNHALGHFLPKKFTQLPLDTRPISVPNTDNRIIASAIYTAILPAVASCISDKQTCAIPARDIRTNIDSITSAYYASLSRRQQHYILFTDFSKAFDSVRHDWILSLLEHIGMPPWVTTAIAALLTELATAPAMAPHILIHILRGVKQGCPLSPLLFILAIDPTLRALTPEPFATTLPHRLSQSSSSVQPSTSSSTTRQPQASHSTFRRPSSFRLASRARARRRREC